MPAEPSSPTTPINAETEASVDTAYSHLTEVNALRRVLARLEAKIDRADDPAALIRLAGAIARVSDALVRALAAHHRLAERAEKAKLADGRAQLEVAREQQREDGERRERDRALWFSNQQQYWLERLAEAARDAAAGDPAAADEVARGLDAYIEKEDFVHSPDRHLLARLRNEASGRSHSAGSAEFVPFESNLGGRDPVVQLR